MNKVIVFDFDGVICDSTEECLITGYNAWLKYQNKDDFVTKAEDIPFELAGYFRSWRGLVRTAGQYFSIFNSYNNSRIKSEPEFEQKCAQYKREMVVYEKLFFEARDKLRTRNAEYWIKLHHTYDGIPRNFKRLSEWADVFVVTGKDRSSVKTFLKHIGIEISESRIYDKNAAADKLAALRAISKSTNKSLEDVVFLDDNIHHLLAPKESGCKAYMAGWGYHSEGHLTLARNSGIEILNLDDWYARINAGIKGSLKTKKACILINDEKARVEMKDNCAYCGSDKYKFITNKLRYGKKGIIVECAKCGLTRLLGAKNFEDRAEEFYQEKYAKEYHRGAKANLDSLFDSFLPVQQERIDRMRKFFRKTDQLLEIGSSVGYFLYSAKKYVSDVYGIELNIEEAKYANDKKNIKTSHKSLGSSEFNSMKFNHICLFQLLEHIPDPVLFLRELRKHLKPRGYIHIEVPNIADPLVGLFDNMEFRDFFYQEPHLYYFSPHTLRNIARKASLEISTIEPFQQTSITNSLNWIYCRGPQPSRWDCIQASLPTRYVSSEKSRRAQEEIYNFLQKINMAYKKILLKNKFTDNIFCTLRLPEGDYADR